jgi:hypothetical protein
MPSFRISVPGILRGVSPDSNSRLTQSKIVTLVFQTPVVVAVGQALESDTPQAVTVLHLRSVGQIVETDLAQHAGSIQIRSELQALESDLAQAVTVKHVIAVGQALTTNLAQPVGIKQIRAVGQATETDVAQAVARIQRVLVNQALESDIAQHTGEIQRVSELQSLESDIALPVGVLQPGAAHVVSVAQTTESDIAQAVVAINVPTPPPTQIFGAGGFTLVSKPKLPKPEPKTKVVAVGQAFEVDSTTRLDIRRIFRPKPAVTVTPKFAEPYFYTTSVEYVEREDELELVLSGII